MTVKEAIRKLMDCNLDATLCVSAEEHGTFEVDYIYEEYLAGGETRVVLEA